MKVRIDGKYYPSKANALKEMRMAMMCCDGSESERMAFAYCSIEEGYTDINTYSEEVGHLK